MRSPGLGPRYSYNKRNVPALSGILLASGEAIVQVTYNQSSSTPTYSYDENQVMHVEFTDIASGKKVESKLEIKGIDDDAPIDGFIVE